MSGFPIRALFTGLLAFACILCSGCVERKLVITSDPEGADVWVNEQWHGKTPYELPFKHYGTFGVRLEKEGYYPVYVSEPVNAQLYQRIGPDLVSEALIPATIRDERYLHYVMRKIEESDDQEGIVSRAEGMFSESDPILERRRRYDLLRQPKSLPLPEKSPGAGQDMEKRRLEAAVEEMKPPQPVTAPKSGELEPLAPLD